MIYYYYIYVMGIIVAKDYIRIQVILPSSAYVFIKCRLYRSKYNHCY